jgi:hypothetical protein
MSSLPPITEEDKPIVANLIKKLVRLRKRAHAHGSKPIELDDAIKSLQEYGALKGWWPYPDD